MFGCDKGSGLTHKLLLANLMQKYKYLGAFFFLTGPKLQKNKQFEIEFISWFEFHLKNVALRPETLEDISMKCYDPVGITATSNRISLHFHMCCEQDAGR